MILSSKLEQRVKRLEIMVEHLSAALTDVTRELELLKKKPKQ